MSVVGCTCAQPREVLFARSMIKRRCARNATALTAVAAVPLSVLQHRRGVEVFGDGFTVGAVLAAISGRGRPGRQPSYRVSAGRRSVSTESGRSSCGVAG